MIAIVSSNPAERLALSSLCESRSWPHLECESVRAFRALLGHTLPRVVLVRNRLEDGYSDDVFAALKSAGLLPSTKTIVLLAAGTSSAQEARQVALGADCVHRDPARADVLVEYLDRYRAAPGTDRQAELPRAVTRTFPFASAVVRPSTRTIECDGRKTTLTPRELAFAELLSERHDDVVSYHAMYSELLGRRFAGDTSNMRVLLGKLGQSLERIDLNVRDWIEVIPKTGYRYHSGGR
ncbi:winged helix-turn-helix domain-containing protein [Opitutus sp. ER46]|uniref:winged helix-turn-helix domain-containing protein n=1 Tax=Opitutus sp. ER46 TaxID=2161864 RepID=UPI000D324BB7|nr:winged helix-turn-helix domain-containing protein [Opitutus sp. ER46]PTY01078.1 hypothetical protein DB354_00655 [Opitutus sp. ER46]